ncbi:MAG TPA: type III pantothenate kinase [Steroidobacteraceae bacterium]|nr:type III pantothenate kinase [Steroidobacteraceae bacterium]
MNQLLIDAGNTRLKWATLRGGRLGRREVREWNSRTLVRVARRAFAGRVARVLVCSVAGTALERALRQAARATGAPAPQFIRSTRRAAGVRNGYAEPWRLGADRWVALLGARARYPGRALCIVDVGTALTIDLLDSAGQHRGGLITPGPALMVESLLRHTAGIRRRAGGRFGAAARSAATFGRSTRAGLLSGSALACAALIERSLREARVELGGRPRLLLAGGGAAPVARFLRVAHDRVDALVIQGLAMLAARNSR